MNVEWFLSKIGMPLGIPIGFIQLVDEEGVNYFAELYENEITLTKHLEFASILKQEKLIDVFTKLKEKYPNFLVFTHITIASFDTYRH